MYLYTSVLRLRTLLGARGIWYARKVVKADKISAQLVGLARFDY